MQSSVDENKRNGIQWCTVNKKVLRRSIQNQFLYSHKWLLCFNSNDLISIHLTLQKCDYSGKNSNKKYLIKLKRTVIRNEDSGIGTWHVKAVYRHSASLTYMQSASWETLGWKKHKLESRLPGEISITSDMQMTPPISRKRRTQKPLDKSERGEGKKLA